MSLLHTTIINDSIHQLRMYLTVGVKVDVRDAQGRTPLMVACFMTNKKRRRIACELLLAHGANVDLRDKFKRTVLMYACSTRNIFLLRELLQYIDTDLNKTDNDGNTCLMYAAIEGDIEVMKLILEPFEIYGIGLDLRNKRGFTAYLLALKNGNVGCAQILKDKGASINIFDSENYWGGKEWLASHYKNRLNRESLQSAHIVRSKSQNMQRGENNQHHDVMQRPRSMPPSLHHSNYLQTPNSQANYHNVTGAKRSKRNLAATSLVAPSSDDRTREFKSQEAAKRLKTPRPVTGSSVRTTVPRAKIAWNDENEVDASFEDQKEEIGDYDIIVRPLTGCSFRSEAITTEGKSDFGDSVSISIGYKHRKKQQQQRQLFKLFEEYSMNQVPIPPEAQKRCKRDSKVKRPRFKSFEMQKREQSHLSSHGIPMRKRKMSKFKDETL